MKKLLIFSASVLIAFSAFAVNPNDKELMIRNNTNTGNLLLFSPDTGLPSIVGWDPSSTSGRTDGGTGSYTTLNISSGLAWDFTAQTVSVTPTLAEYNGFTLPNNNLLMRNNAGALAGTTITAIGQAVMASANAAAMKATIFTGSASDVVLNDGSATVLNTTNVPEGSNLYFTNARAVTALTGQNISLFNNNSGYITSSALSPYLLSTTAAATYQPVFTSQGANTFFAGPNGTSGTPSFRSIVAADIPALNQSTTGNASTATKLTTARTIGGVSFDGSANISLTSGTSILKGNGTGGFSNATSGTDYQVPITLTTTGTSGAATLVGATLNVPQYSVPSRTFNSPSRALNSCYQISSTQDASFSYAVDVSTGLSLTSGGEGTVTITSYTNSGCTTGATDIISGSPAQTGSLVVGLGVNQKVPVALSGMVQGGRWVKITTANTVGTPTFAIRSSQQEVLF